MFFVGAEKCNKYKRAVGAFCSILMPCSNK